MSGGKSMEGKLDAVGSRAAVLLKTVQEFIAELHPHGERAVAVTLDSSLDRDLGIDSLGRVELLMRIERTFNVSLPEQVLASAETPRDLLRAMSAATVMPKPAVATQVSSLVQQPSEIVPSQAATLIEVLDSHVLSHPDRPHIILHGASGEEERISYAALRQGAQAVAAGLLRLNLEPGQTVALMLPTSRDYFYSFFGILLAGAIPVPIYPPARLSQIEDHLRRHAGILSNALATILVTVPEAKALARLLKSQVPTLHTITTVGELSSAAEKFTPVAIKSQDIAFLQYTSGSTGNPKGVVLTHANLLANIRAMGEAAQVSSKDVFVSWLPLYHDMGLIGAWLGSLYFACQFVVMSPLTFLAHPARWLWAIHRYRGTLSAAPNFAYELCLRKIEDREIEGLDLNSLRMAFNGAEPVSPDTVVKFTQRFARYGLRPDVIAPVYGLAESSVGLAFPPPGRGPLIDRIQRDAFTRTGNAVPAGNDETDVLRFVACGQPLPGHQIRIVDDTGREIAERVEGRLEFKGPSATSGYFRNPEQTRNLFHGDWLDSGDLAYIAGVDVYITGRVKDIIIHAGRNIYPHELEEAVGNIPGIRKGCVAVFGSPDPASRTERLVVMAETREKGAEVLDKLRLEINSLSSDLLGSPPDDIVLAPVHSVLKTSSGKIRRAASRELYEKGLSEVQQRAVWWQFVRLSILSVLPELRRLRRVIADVLYAAYAWTVFSILAQITLLIAVLLPRPEWSWAVSHVGARLLIRLSGVTLTVQGLDSLASGAPCVLVANHTSYLDGILLIALLPRPFGFVAKRELLDHPIAGIYLRHIDASFVERFALLRGVEDAEQLSQSVREGRSLAFFPEGTFYRMPGLLPFHMGAFVAAAQAGVPVVPVSIRGTRSILRADHWFPRRGSISVTIGVPIEPKGSDWSAAIQLRDAARAEILRHCGEPDLTLSHALKLKT
ncbi:MAG TPA: AMP-binding protein [Gammaproteobacteria bacterium]|nr:AMP-binding protein [Gammaproteobacteria bacterium]